MINICSNELYKSIHIEHFNFSYLILTYYVYFPLPHILQLAQSAKNLHVVSKQQSISSSAIPPPTPSTHSTIPYNNSSRSKAYAVNLPEEDKIRHKSNKRVTITANDSVPKLEKGEHNKNGTFFKRVFNAIVRKLKLNGI